MCFVKLEIPEVVVFTPKTFGDHRGFFSETFNSNTWSKAGFDLEFVQDNHSLSTEKGTVRGLHFQSPPHAQTKLLRVVAGAVFDVAVDVRRGSPTFGKWVSAIISARKWNQILVPAGFAHGFCTLQPETQVLYKVTGTYAPDHEFGIRWNDPALGIDWPVDKNEAIVSEKDRHYPNFADLGNHFTWP